MSDDTYLVFPWGSHLKDAATMLVEAVAGGAASAEGKFNDVTLKAVPGTTVAEILAAYDFAVEAAARAYRESPEGKARKAASEARLRNDQAEADLLLQQIDTLDFSNDVAVLAWLRRFQGPSDHVGVQANKLKVLAAFDRRGFCANENIGEAYREHDRENTFRYLVGQALSCLQSAGAIHGIFLTFHDRWLAKFEPSLTQQGSSQ